MNLFFRNHWLKLLAIIMLIIGLWPHQFVYYQLMNWVVLGAALVTVQQAYQRGYIFIVWLFGLVAVVFNPLAPLHFRADIWQILDILGACLFISSFAIITGRPQRSRSA